MIISFPSNVYLQSTLHFKTTAHLPNLEISFSTTIALIIPTPKQPVYPSSFGVSRAYIWVSCTNGNYSHRLLCQLLNLFRQFSKTFIRCFVERDSLFLWTIFCNKNNFLPSMKNLNWGREILRFKSSEKFFLRFIWVIYCFLQAKYVVWIWSPFVGKVKLKPKLTTL